MTNVFTKALVAAGLATEDEAPATPVAVAPIQTAPSFNQQIAQAQAVFQSSATSTDPAKDAEIMEKLQTALVEGKTVSASYYDFATFLSNMEKNLGFADERTKYMAAFAALAAQGVTPDTVVSTSQHYLDILQTEENGFGEMLNKRLKIEVQSKIDEQTQIDQQVAEINKQMQELSQKIMDLNNHKIQLGNDAAQAKAGLEIYANTFTAVKNRLVQQIQTTVMKFSGYIIVPKA